MLICITDLCSDQHISKTEKAYSVTGKVEVIVQLSADTDLGFPSDSSTDAQLPTELNTVVLLISLTSTNLYTSPKTRPILGHPESTRER